MKKTILLFLANAIMLCTYAQSTFVVTTNGTTPEIDAAIDYATDIWSQYLTSTVPIKVEISFEAFGPGLLGTGLPNHRQNFTNAPMSDVWYPTSLANAFAGTEVNPGEVDMHLFFNSDINWYYETDGNPSSSQFDFVSVLLHEVVHGLGGVSLVYRENGIGCNGCIPVADLGLPDPSFEWPNSFEGHPSAWDLFLVDGNGSHLIDTLVFPDQSTTLGDALVSNDIYFSGSNAIFANNGNQPKIYAPATYAYGSSINHFDENSYPPSSGNALFTPFSSGNEVNHLPGPMLLGALMDIGWNIELNRQYVDVDATGNNDGSSWTNAYTTLHDALEVYEEGDEIWVAAGTYLPQNPSAWTDDVKQTFYIHQDVKLYGGFAGTESTLAERDIENNPTILSGDLNGDDTFGDIENNREDNVKNVVYVDANVTVNTEIDGFIISGGHANNSDLSVIIESRGGGLFSWGAVHIQNCTFRDNLATGYGGGLYYRDVMIAGAYVNNCHFENNYAGDFGAGLSVNALLDNEAVLIENCTFENNSAEFGGGIEIWRSNVTVRQCFFTGNETNSYGSALTINNDIPNGTTNVLVQDCEFSSNTTVNFGGALGLFDGDNIIIDHCLFKENSGPLVGGIFLLEQNSNTSISNCIFDANEGQLQAIFGDGVNPIPDQNVDINNCLFINHSSTELISSICSFQNSSASFSNNTFSNNESSGIGINTAGTVHLQNNIFDFEAPYASVAALNVASDEGFVSLGGNLFSDETAAIFALSVDLQNADPLLETDTYQLSEDSPCVDAGVLPEDFTDVDLAGNARVQGGCIDMGAYESVYDSGTACVTNTREVLLDASSITLYPNPVAERTTVALDNDWQGDVQVRIINMLGQVQADFMVEKTSMLFQMDLDTNILPQGSYKILISNGEEMAIASFVKI